MAKIDKIHQASFDQNTECENDHKKKDCIYKRLQHLWELGVELLGKNYRIVLLIMLFLLYVFFIPFWENIIAKTLVDKFLSHFERNIISDLIFYLISLCLIINSFFAKPKLHSPIKYAIYIIAFVLWVYYRFISKDKFELYSFTTISFLKYFDIIAVYAFCNFVVLFRRLCKKQKNKPIEFKEGFIRDVPIDNEEDDDFERRKFARAAVDKILRTDTTKEAFSYGIVSPWGMGKTSFMNLMKKWIDQKYSENCIVIDFNPWRYSRDANVVELFFDELNNVLRPDNSRLANSFINYSKALSAIGTTETKIASAVIDLIGRRSSLDEKINIIRKIARNTKKRIVIFIDDIDRLEPNEIMDVLKLVRNVSNFPNMYFVVAYDKEYLLECLKDKMSTKASDFTEKIFNTEFYLPLCVKDTLKEYIEKYVSSDVSVDEKKELHKVIYGRNIFNDSDIDAISTVRDVKRICNSFNASYSRLKREVNICDLFMLEILKNKYPTVYAILENHWNLILQNKNNRYELFIESGENDLIDVSSPFDLKKYIKKNNNSLHIKEIDIKRIENLLDALFPHTIMAKEKSISDIHYFDRYFNLALLESDISDVEFDKLLQSDIEEIKSKFKDWAANKTSALLPKFDMLQSRSRNEKKKHIRILLYSISILPNSILDTDTHMCDIITNKIIELGEVSTDDKEFIKNALCENGYSRGLGGYLNSIKEKRDYPLSRKELNIVRSNLFKDCVERHYDNMEFILQGFQSTTDSYLENGEIKVSYIPANNDLMKKYATSHFPDFIKLTIERKPYSDKEYRYSIGYLPLRLWESLDNYISFIRSIEVKTPIIDEYLVFVERCKEENTADGLIEPVVFEFKYIEIGESNVLE